MNLSGSGSDDTARIASVGCDIETVRLLSALSRQQGAVVDTFASGASFLAGARGDYALVIGALEMPGMSGTELLAAADKLPGRPPVVLVGSRPPLSVAVEAIKAGAMDVLETPLQPGRLSELLERVCGRDRSGTGGDPLFGLPPFAVGRSPAWLRLLEKVRRVAPLATTVLIRGETGTGKEVVAKLIVALGPRARRQFISLNCAALPETLIESELFGHMRGAFSGATTTRRGLFEEASGGTIFLDEIGTLPPASQAKLLRVLDEGRVRRVGDNRFVAVETRVLAATSLDIEAAIGRHEFREDLYFRLAAVSLEVPPLRERRSDIPLLVERFLEELQQEGARRLRLSEAALGLLLSYRFPGNVRELKHAIAQAAVFAAGDELGPDDFATLSARSEMLPAAGGSPGLPQRGSVESVTPEELTEAFRKTGGNKLEAAKVLGISRSSLYRILRKMPEGAPA